MWMLCGIAVSFRYSTVTEVSAGAVSVSVSKVESLSDEIVNTVPAAPAAGDGFAAGVGLAAGAGVAAGAAPPAAPSFRATSTGFAPTPAGNTIMSPATAGAPLIPAGACQVQTSAPVVRSSA